MKKDFEEVVACVHCGKLLYDEDYIWQIRKITADGQEMYSPTCSEYCAKMEQQQNAEIHRRRLYDVEHQGFQKMRVKDYV